MSPRSSPRASARKRVAEQFGHPRERKLILAVAATLDGYIARRDGSVDWLTMDPALDMAAFMNSVDVIIAGRKTLEPHLAANPQQLPRNMACYIFSRTRAPGKHRGCEYVNRPPPEVLREIREQPGKNIWLMGGGELTREFLREDLVDEIELGVMPVLLGDGIPLFPKGFPQRNFTLLSQRAYPSGIISLSYARKPRVASAE